MVITPVGGPRRREVIECSTHDIGCFGVIQLAWLDLAILVRIMFAMSVVYWSCVRNGVPVLHGSSQLSSQPKSLLYKLAKTKDIVA